MGVVSRRPMTLPQFLAWEERQETRWEFDGAQPVAMTGGTFAHETIGATLRAVLRERLRDTPCRVLGPTMKIEVAGRIRYPDAFVFCKPAASADQVISDPVVIFEVASPGTARTDRIVKLREYQSTDSVQRYVILEQDSIAATVFAREGGVWTAVALIDGDALTMPEIGVEIALAEIYVDIDLPVDEEAPAER